MDYFLTCDLSDIGRRKETTTKTIERRLTRRFCYFNVRSCICRYERLQLNFPIVPYLRRESIELNY